MAAIVLPFVTTYDDSGARKANTSLAGLVKSYGGVSIATGLLANAFKTSVSEASKLQETVSKNKVIFGNSADAVRDFASTAAEKLGQSEQQALEAASTFAAFGKSAGLAGEELVTFSTDLVSLSSDLASFANTSPEEAITAIGAALRGESEPIRKYNVLLNDLTLKQRAAKLGIYDGVGALTQQEKVLAAQAEILAQTGDAMGDFARTQDGLANGTRILTARLKDLAADAGGEVLPFLEDLITVTNSLIDETDRNKGSFSSFVTVFGKVVDDLVPAIKVFQLISDVTGKWADNIRGTEKQLSQTAGKFREFEERQMARYLASKNEDIKLSEKNTKAKDKEKEAFKKYADTLRERVKTAYDATTESVQKAQEEFDSYKNSLVSVIEGSVSLSEAFRTQKEADEDIATALKERAQAYADLKKIDPTEDAERYAEALEKVATAEENVRVAADKRKTASTEQVFADQIANAREFAQNLQYLVQEHGLGQAALSQLINLGVDAGNEVTRAMIFGTSGITARSLNESLASIGAAAGSFGAAGAQQFYGGALGTALGNQAAVNQYSITVNAGLVSNPAQVGRDIIEAIKQAERLSGIVFAPA